MDFGGKIAYGAIALGLLVCFFFVYPGLAELMDKLVAPSTIWGNAENATASLSPTSEALAQSWKYIFFAVIAGGILYWFSIIVRGRKGE